MLKAMCSPSSSLCFRDCSSSPSNTVLSSSPTSPLLFRSNLCTSKTLNSVARTSRSRESSPFDVDVPIFSISSAFARAFIPRRRRQRNCPPFSLSLPKSGAYKVSKEGFILLQFASAVGTRQYDWNRKQVFSLSVAEMGHLTRLGAKDSCEIFHDPFKGRSEEGKIQKVLKAEPLPDGIGHFFNLSVQNRLLDMDESIYIPITKPELTILKSAFNVSTMCAVIIPYLLGWHAFAGAVKPEISRPNNTRYGPNWNGVGEEHDLDDQKVHQKR